MHARIAAAGIFGSHISAALTERKHWRNEKFRLCRRDSNRYGEWPPYARDRNVPKDFDSILHRGEGPAFPDVSFENERAMWWAEFDSVGEEAVRGYVARHSYTPTG